MANHFAADPMDRYNPDNTFLALRDGRHVTLSTVLAELAMMRAQGLKITVDIVAKRFNISQHTVRQWVVPHFPAAFYYIRVVPPIPSRASLPQKKKKEPPVSPPPTTKRAKPDAGSNEGGSSSSKRARIPSSSSARLPSDEGRDEPPSFSALMAMIPDISVVNAAPLRTPPAEVTQDTQEFWESVLGDAYPTLGPDPGRGSWAAFTPPRAPPPPV